MNQIKKFFKFEERGATFRAEIIGGIVTFLAMSYILVVNPGIASGLWSGQAGIPYGGVFFATVIGAFIATMVIDRKSTRLNSSHVRISYAVFCLKKKKKIKKN